MMGRRLREEWREEDGEEALGVAYPGEKDGMVRPRLRVLWLLLRGNPKLLNALLTATSASKFASLEIPRPPAQYLFQ